MENKDDKQCCGILCHGGHHGFFVKTIIRMVLMFIILAIVFCLGVKIGEFKMEMKGAYGGEFYGKHMMRGGGCALPATCKGICNEVSL